MESLKSRVETERHRLVHRLERMVVAMASLVGRKERMWQRSSSGKMVTLSSMVDECGFANQWSGFYSV